MSPKRTFPARLTKLRIRLPDPGEEAVGDGHLFPGPPRNSREDWVFSFLAMAIFVGGVLVAASLTWNVGPPIPFLSHRVVPTPAATLQATPESGEVPTPLPTIAPS